MQILCPRPTTPVDEYKDKLTAVLSTADAFHTTLVVIEDYSSVDTKVIALRIEELLKSSNEVKSSIEDEIKKSEISTCCGYTCQGRAFSYTVGSILDSAAAIGGVTALSIGGGVQGEIIGLLMVGLGQVISKTNDVISHRGRVRVERESKLKELLVTAETMSRRSRQLNEIFQKLKDESTGVPKERDIDYIQGCGNNHGVNSMSEIDSQPTGSLNLGGSDQVDKAALLAALKKKAHKIASSSFEKSFKNNP